MKVEARLTITVGKKELVLSKAEAEELFSALGRELNRKPEIQYVPSLPYVGRPYWNSPWYGSTFAGNTLLTTTECTTGGDNIVIDLNGGSRINPNIVGYSNGIS